VPPNAQSENGSTCDVSGAPVLYMIVTVLVTGPVFDAPRKPRVVAPRVPVSVIVCAADKLLTLSGLPGEALGQVKVRPPAVSVAPGVMP
jgi:hypothetical protein